MGDGREDAGEKAARTLSTTIDSPPRATAGRKSLKGLEVSKWCVDEESWRRRTTEIRLATRDAPAHAKATIPAVRDGASVGGRMVKTAVVVPSRMAAVKPIPAP